MADEKKVEKKPDHIHGKKFVRDFVLRGTDIDIKEFRKIKMTPKPEDKK